MTSHMDFIVITIKPSIRHPLQINQNNDYFLSNFAYLKLLFYTKRYLNNLNNQIVKVEDICKIEVCDVVAMKERHRMNEFTDIKQNNNVC